MAVRLFVGNLPYNTTEAELRAHFAPVAEPLHIVIPVDRVTGRPRGFAFVDVADREVAEAAIRQLDTQLFKGRPLAVSEARPREPRPPGASSERLTAPRPTAPPRSPLPPSAAEPPRTASAGSEPARRRKAAATTRRERWERGPRGPIRERISGRVYDIAEDDDWTGPDLADFDDFATSARADEQSEKPTDSEHEG